ncbi:hypothetical protein EDD11_004495 [Mortierella claussenii]|nr:hypothetical protein EDD11_004495 [Mortierella claussenii]
MSMRPPRSAKKIISYRVDEDPREKSGNTDASGLIDDSGDTRHGTVDSDDSDEYVESSKDNPVSDGDDDEDGHGGDPEQENLPEDVGQSRSGQMRARKARRRKVVQSFTVSLDQMSELLDMHGNTDGLQCSEIAASNSGGEVNMNITPAKLPHRLAPITTTQRKPRASTTKSNAHKKGELHSSDIFPSHWKQSYQAPTSDDLSHVSMHEDFLRQTVYPNMGSNAKDFRVIRAGFHDRALRRNDGEYVENLCTKGQISKRSSLNIDTNRARRFFLPEAGINDFYLLNVGFSVWALDWCPMPSYDQRQETNGNRSFIAVGGLPDTAENCIARDQLYPLGKQDAHPNMIQIWALNCNGNEEGELQGDPNVYLALCILHSYGAVLDLKWCPTGGLMEAGPAEDDLGRLGILAAAFSDGTIRIFSIPDPDSLIGRLGVNAAEGSTPDSIYIEYLEPYATLRLGDVNFMSINWGTSERLAAGVTNGTVAVWDMKSMLSQTKNTLGEKDSEYLDPIFLPQVHDVCVRCVDWLRSADPAIVPYIIATSGYDGHVRYTDLRDLFTRIDIKTILGVPMASMCIPWAEGTVYVDVDFGATLDQLYVESRGFRLFNAQGTIWDISYSDYQPYLAAAISDGRVKISNPAYKARRGYGMIQNHIYQLQQAILSGKDASIRDGEGDALANSKDGQEHSFLYREGEEKEYISKSDGFLSFYGADVAIQKVQWSRCFHSAAWLASGSAGGLVRIDNTMLRRNEGGSDNKIKYAVEPYIIKKRLASGKAYDEQGRRVGADGQPVKIGRPRKPEAETTRGRQKIAAEAKRKAQSQAAEANVIAAPVQRSNGQLNTDAHRQRVAEPDGHEEANPDMQAAMEVEGTSGAREAPVARRPSRQSVRLAPIFTRTANTTPQNEVREQDMERENADKDQVAPGEAGKQDGVIGESSGSASACREPAVQAKRRGRPRKGPLPTSTKLVASSKTIVSKVRVSTRLNPTITSSEKRLDLAKEGGIIEENEDEIMEDAGPVVSAEEEPLAETATETLKGTSLRDGQRAISTTVGRTAQVVGASQEAVSDILKASKGGKAISNSAFMLPGSADASSSMQDEEGSSSSSTASSQASSVGPNTPRRKRGPQNIKKNNEDKKRQSRSLKDFWGAAASKGKEKSKE